MCLVLAYSLRAAPLAALEPSKPRNPSAGEPPKRSVRHTWYLACYGHRNHHIATIERQVATRTRKNTNHSLDPVLSFSRTRKLLFLSSRSLLVAYARHSLLSWSEPPQFLVDLSDSCESASPTATLSYDLPLCTGPPALMTCSGFFSSC